MVNERQVEYADFREETQQAFSACGCRSMEPQPLVHPVLKTNFTMSMALTMRPAREVAATEIVGQRRNVIQPCIRVHDAEHLRTEDPPWHLSFFEMAGAFSNGKQPRKTCLEILFSVIEDLTRISPQDCLFEPYAGGGEFMPDADDETVSVLRSLGISDGNIRPRSGSFFGRRRDESLMGPMVEISTDVAGVGWREIATIVFLDYAFEEDGSVRANDIPFAEFGIGLERAMCARGRTADIGYSSPLREIMQQFPDFEVQSQLLAADRLRAAVFAISEGIRPARGGRRSILRHLLRDVFQIDPRRDICDSLDRAVRLIVRTYEPHYQLLPVDEILSVMWKEHEHQRQQSCTAASQ